MSLQFIEGAIPTLLVAPARVFVVQARMGERQFGACGDHAKIDLDKPFPWIIPALPSPTHCQGFRFYDLEIFAAALVLAAVECAETNPETPADARIGLGQKHGTALRTPP